MNTNANYSNKGILLDTRSFADRKINELKERVRKLNKKPCLTIIRIGEDFASGKYVANKVRRCEEVGVESKVIHLEGNVTQDDVEKVIFELNQDNNVTGVLLQLPIPAHLDEQRLTNLIAPEKDVDGFTIENAGRLATGVNCNIPCTPRGIIEILREFNIQMEGKNVLIINRSNIVGKPLAQLFLCENATVTMAHSKTNNLKEKIKHADIVVTAVGKANFLRAEDFSNNTTILDVSINFKDGKMCGDVAKEDYDVLVGQKHCNLTPVPNGIGQMTVIELIEQTVEIAERKLV